MMLSSTLPYRTLPHQRSSLMHVSNAQQQELYKDICISDEPYLGIGSSLVQQGNSNVTLLGQRNALGARGECRSTDRRLASSESACDVFLKRFSFRFVVVSEHDLLLCEEFVKGGCPPHLRAKLWKQILQCSVGEKVDIEIFTYKKTTENISF